MGWIWSKCAMFMYKDVTLQSIICTINMHLKAAKKEVSQPGLQLVLASWYHGWSLRQCTSTSYNWSSLSEEDRYPDREAWNDALSRGELSLYRGVGWVNRSEWSVKCFLTHKTKVKKLISCIPSYQCPMQAPLVPALPPWVVCSWAIAIFSITIHLATLLHVPSKAWSSRRACEGAHGKSLAF